MAYLSRCMCEYNGDVNANTLTYIPCYLFVFKLSVCVVHFQLYSNIALSVKHANVLSCCLPFSECVQKCFLFCIVVFVFWWHGQQALSQSRCFQLPGFWYEVHNTSRFTCVVSGVVPINHGYSNWNWQLSVMALRWYVNVKAGWNSLLIKQCLVWHHHGKELLKNWVFYVVALWRIALFH